MWGFSPKVFVEYRQLFYIRLQLAVTYPNSSLFRQKAFLNENIRDKVGGSCYKNFFVSVRIPARTKFLLLPDQAFDPKAYGSC